MAVRFRLPSDSLLDSNANPLSGGTVSFYETGTSTPLDTFSDDDLSTLNTNPVTLDSAGRHGDIFLQAEDYKVVVKDSGGSTIKTMDPVHGADGTSTAQVVYARTAAEISAGVTPTDTSYPYLHLYRYGTNTTPGTTDMSSALQTVADLLAVTGGFAIIPPDDILIGTQVSFSFPDDRCSMVMAYGSSITTGSLTSFPFKLTCSASGQQGCPTIAGLYVNHWSNTQTPGVFEFSDAHHITIRDCGVQKPDNPATGYAVAYIHQSDTSDSNTGSFWNAFERCNFRPNTTPTTKSTDIWIKGAGNATKLLNCSFNQSDVCVLLECEASSSYVANALLVQGCDADSFTDFFQLKSSVAAVNTTSARFMFNRFENGTTLFNLAGGSSPVTQGPAEPFFAMGNALGSGITYLNNPNNLDFNSIDPSVTPDGRVWLVTDDATGGFTFENVSSTGQGLVVRASTGKGIAFQSRDGATAFGEIDGRSGNGLTILSTTEVDVNAPASTSATNIASATASINTTGKFIGKLCWDTTNNRMMRARGTSATDIWDVIDGSASVTPA